jgi:hypothetical protein
MTFTFTLYDSLGTFTKTIKAPDYQQAVEKIMSLYPFCLIVKPEEPWNFG